MVCCFSSTQKSPGDSAVSWRLSSGATSFRRHIELGAVFGCAGDDQRRARLVDQDRVDLVDDGVVEAALEAVLPRHRHVVAQVVETELVVGAVDDVARVGVVLGRVRHRGEDHADRQAEEAVDAPHPLGVAAGEVVVHRDDVDAAPAERVQVRRQRRDQGLALAGAHLGDLAVVQHHAADQLHVEVAHVQHPLARLADHGECLRQELFERGALGFALGRFVLRRGGAFGHLRAERDGALREFGVGELRDLRLQRVDALDRSRILLHQPIIAAAEDGLEDLLDHWGWGVRQAGKIPSLTLG